MALGGMHPGQEGHLGAIGQHAGIDVHGVPGGIIHDRGGGGVGGGVGQPVKKGIQTSPDGTVKNIPPSMVTDQFGMIGLLTFIRAAETDPNLVSLALGADLTTLGLNLNSEVSRPTCLTATSAIHLHSSNEYSIHVIR